MISKLYTTDTYAVSHESHDHDTYAESVVSHMIYYL